MFLRSTSMRRPGTRILCCIMTQVGSPINRTFQTIVLQNEYLELVILPELGGRIYQCRFLPTGQPLLYNSRVAKPTNWGPSDQGWWLALGGIEFALPVDEHGYLTAQPWDASVTRQGDGGATVVLQIQEATRGLQRTRGGDAQAGRGRHPLAHDPF